MPSIFDRVWARDWIFLAAGRTIMRELKGCESRMGGFFRRRSKRSVQGVFRWLVCKFPALSPFCPILFPSFERPISSVECGEEVPLRPMNSRRCQPLPPSNQLFLPQMSDNIRCAPDWIQKALRRGLRLCSDSELTLLSPLQIDVE